MTDFYNILENDRSVKVLVIDKKGSIQFVSQGVIDAFDLDQNLKGSSISDSFPMLDFSEKGVYIHQSPNSGEFKFNISSSVKNEIVISIEKVELSQDLADDLLRLNKGNEFLIKLINETSIVSVTDEKGNIKDDS